MSTRSLILSCVLWPFLGGCPSHQAAPDSAQKSKKTDTFAMIKVKDGVSLVYSFFDSRAELRHVDQIKQVENTARADVMVTDEKRKLPGDLVFVADLRKKKKDRTFRVWVENKSSWFDRMMPQKSMLDGAQQVAVSKEAKRAKKKKKRRPRRVRRPRKPKPDPARAAQPKAPARQVNVILFSTQWCPACKKARAYFTQRRIPFREMDVQKDPQAAQLYMRVVKSARLKPGLVPVIVVNGRVFGGFSPPHIEAALKAGPPRR